MQRILSRWRGRVFSVFERSREPADAAGAAAAVFETLFRTASTFDPTTSFEERIWSLVVRESERAQRADVPAIPPARLKESTAARAALTRAAVAALPPGERSAFLLTRVARLPLPLAAVSCGTSEVEICRRLVRALTALAESLAPLFRPHPKEPDVPRDAAEPA